ncbi:MAG TPA: TrkA family potassium uptake protein [Capsulimonadaceae bacterium]|nr:TrkA family potassium uptake protein [Capsulimonadaceae bacterium]
MYVIVVGAGKVGYYLSKRLMNEGHEVLLMEKDRRRAALLAEELGDIIMQGDGCEVRVMSEAGFGRADVIVAVTGDDEDNLVICQMAKRQFNVPRTLARVNNPVNETLFQKLGIDTTVSSTAIIFSLIDQQIEPGQVIPLGLLKKGNIEVVAISVSERSPVLGKAVKDLALPAHALIISIVRGDNAILPQPDTKFEAGDSVVALASAETEPHLRMKFAEE